MNIIIGLFNVGFQAVRAITRRQRARGRSQHLKVWPIFVEKGPLRSRFRAALRTLWKRQNDLAL